MACHQEAGASPPTSRNTSITLVRPIFSAHARGRAQGSASASTPSAHRSSVALTIPARPQQHAHPSAVLFKMSSRTSIRAPASSSADANPTAFYFKSPGVRNPAGKLMLVEEQTSHKRGESPDVGGTSSIVNDGRWVPGGDKITVRHNKKGNSTFADGHAEAVRPEVAERREYSEPTF